MKPLVKSICAGVGYSLAFCAFGWTAAVLYVEGVVSRFLGFFLFFAVLLALVPAYFFAMNCAKQRWIFRLAVFLSFSLLGTLAFVFVDRFATGFLKDLEHLFFGYGMILAMAAIFLLDALILLFRYVKRQLRSHSA